MKTTRARLKRRVAPGLAAIAAASFLLPATALAQETSGTQQSNTATVIQTATGAATNGGPGSAIVTITSTARVRQSNRTTGPATQSNTATVDQLADGLAANAGGGLADTLVETRTTVTHRNR